MSNSEQHQSQPVKPYELTPHPNDQNITQSQPDQPQDTPTRPKPCLKNPRAFEVKTEKPRRTTKRVSIQPMPLFSPIVNAETDENDPWPSTNLSELNVTSGSYAESLIIRANQVNDDDLHVVDSYERQLRKVTERNTFLENQNKHKDRVIDTKNELLDNLRQDANKAVIVKRKLEYRIRKLESNLTDKEKELKFKADDVHERDQLYQGARVDLLKNKHRMNKLCNGFTDISYILQMRELGTISLEDVRKERLGGGFGYVKWTINNQTYNLNGNNDHMLAAAVERDEDDVMCDSLDNVSTDASVSQYSLRDATDFDYASCSQTGLTGVFSHIDENNQYGPPKPETKEVACLTEISVSDPLTEKLTLLNDGEVIRPRKRLSIKLKTEPLCERSAMTQ